MGVLDEKFKAIPDRVTLPYGSRPRAKAFSKNELDRIKASYEDPRDISIFQ